MKTIFVKCEKKTDINKVVISNDYYGAIEYIYPSESLPTTKVDDFAVWGFLPIAMRQGMNLHIHGTVSEKTLDSARKVSDIWAQWVVGFYNPVVVTADHVVSDCKPGSKKLTFFSGGVDSTYTAYKSYLENGCTSDSLTVHGMDYKFDDDDRFVTSFKQTECFRSTVFNESKVIKTNIYKVYNKIGCNPKGAFITHVFSLFSCASLFNEYYAYQIASDDSLEQQFIAHPYGNNSVSNRLMENANGNLVTMDDDVTRAEKAEYFVKNNMDLTSLTVCGDYKVRPHNCGKCSKCMRTKAMFYAVNGIIPSIFLDKSFDRGWYKAMPFVSKINSAFIFDILKMVDKNNLQDKFPDYYEIKKKMVSEMEEHARNPLLGMKKKDLLRCFFYALIK